MVKRVNRFPDLQPIGGSPDPDTLEVGPTAQRSWSIGLIRTRPVLAQVAPAAAADTTLYTCPKGHTARGRVFWTERAGNAATIRVAIRPLGVAVLNLHYFKYDFAVAANTDGSSQEIFLTADDIILVRTSTADVSFSFVGEDVPKDEV